MGILSNLEPKEVFRYFEEICSIPHPSYKEEKRTFSSPLLCIQAISLVIHL